MPKRKLIIEVDINDDRARSLAADQYVENVIMDSHGHYPAGRHIVLYDGHGMIEYRDAEQKDIAASMERRDAIEVDPSRESGIRKSGSPPLTEATTCEISG